MDLIDDKNASVVRVHAGMTFGLAMLDYRRGPREGSQTAREARGLSAVRCWRLMTSAAGRAVGCTGEFEGDSAPVQQVKAIFALSVRLMQAAVSLLWGP